MMIVDGTIGLSVILLMAYGAIWDARKRIIPDIVPALLLFIGFAALFISGYSFWSIPLSDKMAGFVIPTMTMLTLQLFKKPVGGGDIKLSAALGFLLGLKLFAAVFTVGSILALVWALIRKQKSVPLGTFLAIGVVICLIL